MVNVDAILDTHNPTLVGIEGKKLDKVRLVREGLEMERVREKLPGC